VGVGNVSTVIIALVLIVASLTLLFARLRPQQAERTYTLLEEGRKVVAVAFLVVFAITALQSGRWDLVLAALLAIAVAALYVAVERPHRRVT